MPSPSLAPSAVSSRGSLSARPLLGRSHAWLVRKPDLVWQILTDFLGGRTGGRATLRVPASKERCGKAFLRRRRRGRTNVALRFPTAGLYFARSSAAEGALLFGLMRLVGMQISSLSCRLFADGPTDARSEREKGSGKKDHPSGSEGGSRAADLVSRENLAAAFFVFSLSRVPLFGSFYASAPRPWPRRHRLEWRRREQKEARSTAVKWGLASGDRRPGREGALWNWSDLGRERIQSPSLPLSPPRGLYLPHIAISPLLRMWGRSRGLRPAKNART